MYVLLEVSSLMKHIFQSTSLSAYKLLKCMRLYLFRFEKVIAGSLNYCVIKCQIALKVHNSFH